ncbi:hypothetical protein H4219_005397 [Mycoemilia scoparia]|uniref:Uncharacterized protein n=1 Tax=Mycoemilia scoparia TaxID=417184 RepID=A0A9W7ZUS7_9FUNG|nr:hypothetical protein H4219_005397 [Mycoemilia scoparia]
MIREIGICDLTAVQTYVDNYLTDGSSFNVDQGKNVLGNIILIHSACAFLLTNLLVKVGINPSINHNQDGFYTGKLELAKRLFKKLTDEFKKIPENIMVHVRDPSIIVPINDFSQLMGQVHQCDTFYGQHHEVTVLMNEIINDLRAWDYIPEVSSRNTTFGLQTWINDTLAEPFMATYTVWKIRHRPILLALRSVLF